MPTPGRRRPSRRRSRGPGGSCRSRAGRTGGCRRRPACRMPVELGVLERIDDLEPDLLLERLHPADVGEGDPRTLDEVGCRLVGGIRLRTAWRAIAAVVDGAGPECAGRRTGVADDDGRSASVARGGIGVLGLEPRGRIAPNRVEVVAGMTLELAAETPAVGRHPARLLELVEDDLGRSTVPGCRVGAGEGQLGRSVGGIECDQRASLDDGLVPALCALQGLGEQRSHGRVVGRELERRPQGGDPLVRCRQGADLLWTEGGLGPPVRRLDRSASGARSG